jgi:hypothetical protein
MAQVTVARLHLVGSLFVLKACQAKGLSFSECQCSVQNRNFVRYGCNVVMEAKFKGRQRNQILQAVVTLRRTDLEQDLDFAAEVLRFLSYLYEYTHMK